MNTLTDTMAARASVRTFNQDRQVSDEVLDDLLKVAMQAPSTGNMQLYSVIVTRDPEAKRRMRILHKGQPAAENCSVLLTFCADTNRFGKWTRNRNAVDSLANGGGMLMGVMDAIIFAQQFVAAAESQGLGTCYLGTVPYDFEGFAKELDLPKGVMPLFSIAVGYPATTPLQSDRLPLDAVVHREKYHDYSPEDIDRIYGPKEEMPVNRAFVAENGLETLAQVYSQVRYPRSLALDIQKHLQQYFNPPTQE